MEYPKFKTGDKVVLVKGYADGSDVAIVEYLNKTFVVEGVEVFKHKFEWCPSNISYQLRGFGLCVCEGMLVLASKYFVDNKQPSSIDLAKKKINVLAYAKQHGISLRQAHVEIQNWLFEQGAKWNCKGSTVCYQYACQLLTDNELNLSRDDEHMEFFVNHENKEITLSRKIVLTPSVVQDTIEFDGKKYAKDDVMKAIGVAGVQQVN